MGRRSTFTQDKADAICERLSLGEPLAQICRDEGMPSTRVVSDWCAAHPDFASDFARARADGYDAIALDALGIADEDAYEDVEVDGVKVAVRFDSTAVQRNRLRVDTRLKLLAKWDPKRYGERVQHANDPDNPLVPTAASDAELEARIRALLEKGHG